MKAFLVFLALLLALVLLNAWAVMLLIGVVHAHVLPAVLATSFSDSIPVAVLISIIFRGAARLKAS